MSNYLPSLTILSDVAGNVNEERFFRMLKLKLIKQGYIWDQSYFNDVRVSIQNKISSIGGSNGLKIIQDKFVKASLSIDDPFEDQFMSAVDKIKVILEEKKEKDLAADQILLIIQGLLPAPAGGARRTKRRKASKRKTRSKRSRRSR
jgi:hypothetical protein